MLFECSQRYYGNLLTLTMNVIDYISCMTSVTSHHLHELLTGSIDMLYKPPWV